jgi:dihydroorotate dehydrogenase
MYSISAVAVRALRVLDPERAHRSAIRMLAAGLVPAAGSVPSSLRTFVWDRSFPHPVGLAAGFDKDGEAIGPLLRAGAGFVEIGAVTPLPQPGNARPRVFRLPEDEAVINRYGFNSAGHELVARRLADFRHYSRMAGGVVGVNLGMNKGEDDPAAAYAAGVRVFARSADFLTINISSPNTPGLRDLQTEEALLAIVQAARAELSALPSAPALLVKLSPDLSDEAVNLLVSRLATDRLVDGWIVSNTTIARAPTLKSVAAVEAGGLSGRPLRARATELVGRVYRASGGMPIIGVGGIDSGRTAYEKIRAGATLVQVYTSLIYHGPGLLQRIALELAECLSKDGFDSVSQAVGADYR